LEIALVVGAEEDDGVVGVRIVERNEITANDVLTRPAKGTTNPVF
jgi:hypothetical protein